MDTLQRMRKACLVQRRVGQTSEEEDHCQDYRDAQMAAKDAAAG